MLQITPAEREALQLLADGWSVSQIAELLELGECELDELLMALFSRMRVRTHLEAVAAASHRGVIEVDPDRFAATGQKSRDICHSLPSRSHVGFNPRDSTHSA